MRTPRLGVVLLVIDIDTQRGDVEHGDDIEVAVLCGLALTEGNTVATRGELIPL